MRSILMMLAAAVSVSAWAQSDPEFNEKTLKTALESSLKDADSAKFRDIKYSSNPGGSSWMMCGEVNAKNSYGGYSGFEPFTATSAKNASGDTIYLGPVIGIAAKVLCERSGLR